jgi:tetratricopeptide (TPR) repeat protein
MKRWLAIVLYVISNKSIIGKSLIMPKPWLLLLLLLLQHVKQSEPRKRLMALEGVAEIGAAGLFCSLGNGKGFKNGRQAAVYICAWRGEGNINQSRLHLAKGQNRKAIKTLEHAIKVDPYFDVPYINLADIYRSLADTQKAARVYVLGLKSTPTSAMLHYSYAMHLVRNKNYKGAISSLETALNLTPSNSQIAYVYIVALDSTGQLALARLKSMTNRFRADQQMIQLGLSLAQKLQDQPSFNYFQQLTQ